MAEIKVPIQVNLPDDWVEQIIERLRNDPEAEWVEIVRCKDCIRHYQPSCLMAFCGKEWTEDNGFCHVGERRTDETD